MDRESERQTGRLGRRYAIVVFGPYIYRLRQLITGLVLKVCMIVVK